MHKKIISCVMALLAATTMITTACASTLTSSEKEFDGDMESRVRYISGTDDLRDLDSFLESGGVAIILHDTYDPQIVENHLEIPLGAEFVEDEENTNKGRNIATLYYHYGAGRSGTYIINVSEESTTPYEQYIEEALYDIRIHQDCEDSEIQTAASSDSAKSLGTVRIVKVKEPKGKITASYEVFTVQDYQSQDFYIVKANINGMPGCILEESNDAYESKYQGEELGATISTSTSSVTINAYGPERTINSSSYTVNIGGAWSAEGGFGISGGFSYTKNIYDTDIDVACTSKKADWDVTMKGEAQKTNCSFYPAVTFVAPGSKTSLEISVSASYLLDAFGVSAEEIELSGVLTCTPQSVSGP